MCYLDFSFDKQTSASTQPDMKRIIFLIVYYNFVLGVSYVNSKNPKSFNSFSASNTLLNEDVKSNDSHDPTHRISQSRYCQKPAVCEKLKHPTCLGVKLPYISTSTSLVPNVGNQEDIQKKLQKWRGLMHIPRCWSVIQPYLCALYMPKCENNLVVLPSKEMCETIQSPCRLLQTDDLWPLEFNCDASFESLCTNDVRDLRFNTTGECKLPLVRATDEASFYEGVEGCGIQCHNPFYTEEERQDIRVTIKWGSVISCICNGFAVITYLINRPFAGKYPAQAVFWKNLCFLLVSFGFLWQFLGSHERTICHADGTLRTSEPSRENLSCIMNFIVVYYFLVAGIVWCIIFAYTWLLRSRSQTYDKIKCRKDKWSSYYHMVAWSIPLVLTVIISALQQVDGDSLLGICFVGVINKDMRLIFLLGPLLVLIIGCVFLGWCIFKLIYLKQTSKEVMSKRAKEKIHESICKLTGFLCSILIFMCVTFYCQVHEWNNYNSWKKSFKRYLVCELDVVGDIEVENCRMLNRPNVALVQFQLCILFLFHVSVAAWIFTACSTVGTWKRFIYERILRHELEENVKLKKYKVIARAFEKRKCLDSDRLSNGVISIDLKKSYQDPVGLDFDLNSIGSNESTTWVKIIPHLMKRRVGIIPVSHSNRNSTDSEISYSYTEFQRSRRQSLDSTQETTSYRHIEFIAKPRSKRHQKRQRRTQSCSPEMTSKGNSKQFEDELEFEVLQALKIGNFKIESNSSTRSTDRRMAIADIEMDGIKLLTMGKSLMDKPLGDSSCTNGESGSTSDVSKSDVSGSANNSVNYPNTETVH